MYQVLPFTVLVDRIDPQISFTELLQKDCFFAVLGAADLNLKGLKPFLSR
ncbi:MAG: hypothetical protein N2578_09975 [Bdellovibrionaceae bacterium]|nr:hypothetical protein [Pseudobdellovibrionaceae bacterium]